MIIKGHQIICNYVVERKLCKEDYNELFSFERPVLADKTTDFDEQIKLIAIKQEKELEYLIQNKDKEIVVDYDLGLGLIQKFLSTLSDVEFLSITTSLGSLEMGEVILQGNIDFIGGNYIILKNACVIGGTTKVENTYFSHKNIPGEAIIFQGDVYSFQVVNN